MKVGELWKLYQKKEYGLVKVYKEFKIVFLRLIFSGIMLITAKDGKELIKQLNEKVIDASIIEKISEQDEILVDEENKIWAT